MKALATKTKALGKRRPPGYLQGREHERAAILREIDRWIEAYHAAGERLGMNALLLAKSRIEAGNHL